MTTPCRESVALGAYLLGALDPEERRALEVHLGDCPHCRAELLELAPLPGLLRHTAFEELLESAAAAESLSAIREPWDQRDRERQEGRGQREDRADRDRPDGRSLPEPPQPAAAPPRRRRGRGRLVAAGLGLAAAVAGVAVYAAVGRGQAPVRPVAAATWSATDPVTHVSATAAMTPEVWGTQFQLKLTGLPSGITCRLVVHGSDGRSETAGTWGSGYSASASVPASTSISPSQITDLDIVSGTGAVLVQVPPG
jgi:anti-sigma factor RsiW